MAYMRDVGGVRLDTLHVPGVGAVIGAGETVTAMQAKITAAGAGASVYFGADISLATALAPLDYQHWYGPGVLTATAGNSTELVTVSGKTGVTLDVTLDGGLATVLQGNPGAGLVPVRNGINIADGSTNITVRGKVRNVPGTAVRIYDSSNCTSSADLYNCHYGVLIGSGGTTNDPGGYADHNAVQDCTIDTIAKNAIFFVGHTGSLSGPNPVRHGRVENVNIIRFGDTGIELGQGSASIIVKGVSIDGGETTPRLEGWGFNGILVRDSSGHAISGCTIRNIPQYVNGNGVYVTLGNGIYFWPQFTGVIKNVAVSDCVIENCSRGVFAQGNNNTFPAATDAINGGAGSAGQIYAGCSITNVVVNGTQLGMLDGSWSGFETTLSCHGFYVQSVSGFMLTGCVARDCKNDGFRVGDSTRGSAFCTDVTLTSCLAMDNGQQNVTGQNYHGFRLAGTTSQGRIKLSSCHAIDTRASGSKTQDYGYSWNSSGTGGQTQAAFAVNCTGTGNGVGLNEGMGIAPTLAQTAIVSTAGNYTVAADAGFVVYTGTGGHTVTLPSAVFAGPGREVTVRNSGTAALTVTRSGGATITKTSVAVGETYRYVTDGASNWF